MLLFGLHTGDEQFITHGLAEIALTPNPFPTGEGEQSPGVPRTFRISRSTSRESPLPRGKGRGIRVVCPLAPIAVILPGMENWHDPDYEMIAALYAAEFPPAEMDDPDAAFLLAFAARTGGPVLDLGCGAGRFLVPLAEAGYAVTGVDTSAAMLAEAEAAVTDAGGGGEGDAAARRLPHARHARG